MLVNYIWMLVILGTAFGITFRDPDSKQYNKINVAFDSKTFPDTTVCGTNIVKDRVHGGYLTEIGEFPWLVALEYEYKGIQIPAGIRCGGTLINNRYVLTAVHCLIHKEFRLINVRLGEWNLVTHPDCQVDSPVNCVDSVETIISQMIPHLYYSSRSGDNDIGLVKMVRDVKYNQYIRPICLSALNNLSNFGSNFIVAGWGATEYGETSNVLLKVEVPLLSNENCSTKLQMEKLDGNYICAGGVRGKDACEGDSGGPLMRLYEDPINNQLRWYQEGVVAYGKACGREGYPAVYTRISRYMVWIIRKISKD